MYEFEECCTSSASNKFRLGFLWAFIDKVFGLGFTTCRDAETGAIAIMCEKAWINGGSPTFGFLKFGTHGPLAGFYQSLAGSALVEWLFMLGIGVVLILGIMTRIAVWSGVAMMLLMYSAGLPPEHNPVVDEHIIYALLLIMFYYLPVSEKLSLSRPWAKITNNNPWLR